MLSLSAAIPTSCYSSLKIWLLGNIHILYLVQLYISQLNEKPIRWDMHVTHFAIYCSHTFLLQLFYIGIIDEVWQVYISSVNTVVKLTLLLQCLHSSPYLPLIVYTLYILHKRWRWNAYMGVAHAYCYEFLTVPSSCNLNFYSTVGLKRVID